MEAAYIDSNDFERARLFDLLDRITDAELATRLPNGLTVAQVLLHLAFWDRSTLAALRRWQVDGFVAASNDFESVNAAVLAIGEAIPDRAIVSLMRAAADEVDREAASVPPTLAADIIDGGKLRSLERALHRRVHLDQIDAAIGGC